jgi:ubiquinone/menaquinone biosynthesis C-methylase UbiE
MLTKILDRQYRRPTGLLGFFIGRQMARDHQPENLWTVSILNAQPSDHILELGFGSGFAIQALTKVVTQGKISGVDYSRVMVSAARWRNSRAIKTGRVDLRWADAAALPFDDHSFDKAYSIHSIYFWPQPLVALKEVWRVLKPDGSLVMTILPREEMEVMFPDSLSETPEFKSYSGEELAQLLIQAGFSETRIASDTNPAYRSNFSVIGVK